MVQTVLGPIEPDEMGTTIVHEHLFIDTTCWFAPARDERLRSLANEKVTLERAAEIRRAFRFCKDNLLIADSAIATKEVRCFNKAGGKTMFETTPVLPGRDPKSMSKVSKRTGTHVVAGCGYYVQSSHPSYVSSSSTKDLAKRMETELTRGIGETDVRAGLIGEIGISPDSMTPDEQKVLKGAALAHKNTGVPITIHTFEPFHPERRQGHRVLDILEGVGVNLKKVYMSHLDSYRHSSGLGIDVEYLAGIAKRGAYISMDGFGTFEWPAGADCFNLIFPTDFERALAIRHLIDMGYGDKIVVSHDVCLKTNWKVYGGNGYDHLLVNAVPLLKRFGVKERGIEKIFVENPRRLMS